MVDSESDDRGILAMDDELPAGPLSVATRVWISADGVEPQVLRELVEWADQYSPVSDIAASPDEYPGGVCSGGTGMRSAVTSPSWAVEATHRDVRAFEEMLLDVPVWPGDEPKWHRADAEAPPAEGAVDVHVEVQLPADSPCSSRHTSAGAWSRRHAAALVKLLALSPGGRLHRDRVVDTLWPT